MVRSPWLWLLVGGLPGLVAWWLLFRATGPARRGLLVAAGVLTGGLLLATAAGYAAAQAAPPAPRGTSLLPGAVFLAGAAGGIALAAVAGLWAWRARREPPAPSSPQQQEEPGRDAPGPASAPPQPTTPQATRWVVVRGCPPQEAATLEGELQGVAEVLGRHLVVWVTPRGPRASAFLHGEALVVQVRRPQLHLVGQALFASLNNGATQVQRPLERQRLPSAIPAPRRLRHDDLAAAVGEGAGKGEG